MFLTCLYVGRLNLVCKCSSYRTVSYIRRVRMQLKIMNFVNFLKFVSLTFSKLQMVSEQKAIISVCYVIENIISQIYFWRISQVTYLEPGQTSEIEEKNGSKIRVQATAGPVLGPPWKRPENGYLNFPTFLIDMSVTARILNSTLLFQFFFFRVLGILFHLLEARRGFIMSPIVSMTRMLWRN